VGPRSSNSYWNDKVWHDRFIGRLGKGAKVWTFAVAKGDLWRSTWSTGDYA
jgi:hypothetical protein